MRKKRGSTSTQVSTTHPILHATIERALQATHPSVPRHPTDLGNRCQAPFSMAHVKSSPATRFRVFSPKPICPFSRNRTGAPPPSISFQLPNIGPPNLCLSPPAIRWRKPTPGSSILSGVLPIAFPPCVFNRAAPAVPPPHPPHPGIHICRYSQLFPTARTKSSRSAHYGHFFPQPTPPRCVIE